MKRRLTQRDMPPPQPFETDWQWLRHGIGCAIRDLRSVRSVETCAERAGVSVSRWLSWEKGLVVPPVAVACSGLDCTEGDLKGAVARQLDVVGFMIAYLPLQELPFDLALSLNRLKFAMMRSQAELMDAAVAASQTLEFFVDPEGKHKAADEDEVIRFPARKTAARSSTLSGTATFPAPPLRRCIQLDSYDAALELVRALLHLAEETGQEPAIHLQNSTGLSVFVVNEAPRDRRRLWHFEEFSKGLDKLTARSPGDP